MDISEDERASSHRTTHMSSQCRERVQIVGGRRRWTVEQKLEILRDAFGPGGSVRSAMERHDIGSGSLYVWRQKAMSGELTGVRPVALSSTAPVFAKDEISEPATAVPLPLPQQQHSGQIGIELPSGVRLTVDGAVDGDALARVLAVLGR
jgi:transposase